MHISSLRIYCSRKPETVGEPSKCKQGTDQIQITSRNNTAEHTRKPKECNGILNECIFVCKQNAPLNDEYEEQM